MKILKGFEVFKNERFEEYQTLYKELGEGQNPHTLVITCSDSRIDTSLIGQSNPGDLFIIRNAGNVINNKDAHSSEVATIEYAIQALGIKEILILGHTSCGAVAAKVSGVSQKELPHVHAFLELVEDGGESGNQAIIENIKAQVERFCELDFIRPHLAKGELTVCGALYDFVHGDVSEIVRRS